MKDIVFKGCGTALITPFTKDGVNYKELRKLIEFQIKSNVDALIICGTTGEAATMSMEERIKTIKFAVDVVDGRVPVIAGTGSNNTMQAVEMSKYAEGVGVDALLVVTPYYNKTTQEGLIKHYTMIANSVNLPIILYNVPSRTGLNIAPTTCYQLSKIPNIVAIKEASGNLAQVAEIASLCRDNLAIYSGNDDIILPILSLGGIGVISVLSNVIPKDVHDMTYKFFEGKINEAIDIQLNTVDLTKSLFSEVNPIPVKAACNMIGFDAGSPRLPLVEMSSEGQMVLKKSLNNYGVKKQND